MNFDKSLDYQIDRHNQEYENTQEFCNHDYGNGSAFEHEETYYIDSITLAHAFKCRLCGLIKTEYENIEPKED